MKHRLVALAAATFTLAACGGHSSSSSPRSASPNVPLAITEIAKTLDWMHTTRKTGGLGYSVSQAQTTHAYRALVALGGQWPAPAPPPTTTTVPVTTTTSTTTVPAGVELLVTPTGSDANPCTTSQPCRSLNAAYQRAQIGQTIQVAAGTYSGQAIQHKPGTDGRRCTMTQTLTDTTDCIHFVGAGITFTSAIDDYASDVWLDGGSSSSSPGWTVKGYLNTTSGDSGGAEPTTLPDHVIATGIHSTNVNLSGASYVTYRFIDAGPATVTSGCQGVEGNINENKISINGVGPGPTVPTHIWWDNIHYHDQNGDAGRIASDCHWGGLFIVNGDDIKLTNSVWDHNVVYNVQIQNFAGQPVTNLTFDRDRFGCAVEWLYTGYGVCDKQTSIQFDYRGNGFPSNVKVTNSSFGEPLPGWACVDGPCDFSTDTFTGNVGSPALTPIPPPLP